MSDLELEAWLDAGDGRDRFVRQFTQGHFPPKDELKSAGAGDLYTFAEAISRFAGAKPAWPGDANELVAEERNKLVHRTVQILDQANRMTLRVMEDEDPDDLCDRANIAFNTMRKCLDSLKSTYDIVSADPQKLEAVVAAVTRS